MRLQIYLQAHSLIESIMDPRFQNRDRGYQDNALSNKAVPKLLLPGL